MKKALLRITLAAFTLSTAVACTSAADQVINTQTQVLTQDPTNVSALIERANAFRDKNDFTSALSDLNKALELQPSSFRARLARGKVYLGLKQYENALTDFERTVELNVDSLEGLALKGKTQILLEQNFAQALSDLNSAITKGYNEPDAFSDRAVAHFRLNNKDQAIDDFLKAAELKPEETAALDRAIQLGLEDYRIYFQRGLAHKNDRSYNSAIDDFNDSIRLNGRHAQSFEERSDAYFAQGNCDRAESDLRMACEIDERRLCDAIRLTCASNSSPNSEPQEAEVIAGGIGDE